jgi:LysR family transcriptional regulator, regulator for bpeEF and oprC
MDTLLCMRVYARVVEHGSFVRAADDLQISKPAVTNAIAQLETKLGTRLLHRTTRRLSVTDEGRTYYERCIRILDDVSEADELVSKTRVAAHGRLRVSVPEAFTQVLFVPSLPKFLKRYPELTVELVITDRAVNLVEEGIDCAARGVDMPDDSTLVARRIASARWITCASPAYFELHGRPTSIDDLVQHNCTRFVSPSSGRTMDWRFEENGVRRTFTPQGNLGVTSMAGAVSAALVGIGMTQVPDPVVFHHILSGELEPVLIDYLAPAPTFTIVYPSNRFLTAKVKAFADFIAEIYPAKGWWPEIVAHARKVSPSLARVRKKRS